MEAWENILEHFQPFSDSKECLRILKVAEFTLDKDLARFEQDYVFKTLFKEPILLIKLLKEKNSDPSWSKVISDWLKLLANVVTKCNLDDVYLKMLSELCTLPYDAHTNQQALNCLTSIVKHSNYGVDNITKHLYALELGTSCKAQLAVLVGTICKHHPERVADNINTIWRVFLNLFDIEKYSTPVIKAVLQSIENMLEHFGTELPIIELNIFYEKLIQCFDIERCADVCVSILGKYASLFRERLNDHRVHAQLWSRIDNFTAWDTLKVVYRNMEIKKPEETIKQVKFYASSDNMKQKLTALSLLQTLQDRELHEGLEVGEYLDVAVLEFRMRNGTLTHDCCDAISWCIESHAYHSERLARVALVTYDVIPVGRKRQVVQSILQCAPHMRQDIIEFLLSETCNNPEKFTPVWDDILNKDATELRSNFHVQAFMVGVVKAIGVMLEKIENWTDPLPEHISLLRLTWSVLRAEPRGGGRSFGRVLRRCARAQCEAVPAALLAMYAERDPLDISVDRFTSDAALINCWISLMQVWDIEIFDTHDILKYLQIILSHKSVDAATVNRAIDFLQDFILRGKEFILDENIIDDIYRRIHTIARNKVEDKEGRILRKRAIEFLAKYRRVTADGISPDVVLMTSLKESLFINVPENNVHTKMDLNKILYKALVDDNENALKVLMDVICQNLTIRKESLLQSALYRVLSALSSFSMNWDTLKYYMSHCEPNSAFELVKYILQEKFPDSREKLLHGLEILLSGDVEEDVFGELLEQVLLSETLNNIEADVLMVILRAITDNNILIQKYIIQVISKATNCNDLTKMATEIFVNRIGLFEKEAIEKLIVDLFKVLHNFKSNDNNNAVVVLTFINVLMKQIDCDQFKIISCFIDMDPPNLHVLSCMRREFNMTEEDCEIVYTQNKDRITRRLFEDDILDDINDKLEFLTEFSDTSLLNDDAIDFIVKVIDNVSQNSTVNIHDNLEKCLKRIKSNLTSISLETISNSINGWVKKHLSILEGIGKRYIENKEKKTMSIMKVFCEVFEVESVLERKQILIDTLLFIINERQSLSFFMVEQNLKDHVDCIDIMMKVVDDDQTKAILKGEGSDCPLKKVGIQFCKDFISLTYRHLTRKPYVLLDPQLKDAATLLIDIVKESLKNGDLENILELVDELWPTYLGVSTFEDRHFILLHLSRSVVRLSPKSKPMQWLLQTLDSPDTKTRERIMLIDVIPEGEEYNSAYFSIASRLPTRLDEIKGTLSSYFRGILESFARTRNTKLLEIIMNFASSADARGWWDDAMTVTVYALSVHEDMSLCEDMYRRSECALGGVTRLLVPLLRFSKASFCEEFFSSCLPLLLPLLEKKPRAASMHYTYQKYVQDTIRAFTVLEVLFQKVPRQSIESPKSRLYHKITDKVGDSPFWIVKTACKLGLTLKASVKCPTDADDKMKNSYRLFHCAIYNCVVSALCCRDPSIDVYATVFDKRTWPELIGTDHLSLPIRYQWNRNSAHYTPSQRTRTSGTLTRTLTRTQTHTRTELTRDFTHTLSENPLQYDLHETEVQAQEVPVGDSALNRHECSAALMMVVRKVAPHEPNRPMQLIAAALADELHCNAKWLLAQAICNCKQELKSHASVLRPALLDITANTTTNMFNSVHFDILETIISWHSEEELPSSCIENLNSTIKHLITTTLEYRSFAVVRSLLEKLEKLLDMYPNVVTISGQFFEDKIVDFQSETTKRCIQILKRITKAKIDIPELLPTVIQAIEGKRVSPDVTELFGLALAISPSTEVQKKFRSMLEKTRRSDVAEYIKLLYYTQKGYPKCCDEANFRVVSDLLPKIVGREKVKCVQIIVKCISEGIGKVDNLPLQEVLAEETGLELLTHSLPQISDNDRRQLVLQVANLSDNPKQKETVFKVILKAFQLLISEPPEPASKKLAESSKICSLVRSADDYAAAILPLVGKALMSETEEVRVVQEYLSTDSNVRFCECIAIAVYFPLIYGGSTNMRRALGTALLLYFNQDRQQTKQSTINDKNSRYNIKFSSSLSTMNVRDVETQVSNTQIREPKSPEEVLDELLKYALEDPSVAVTICTQLIQAHRGTKRPGFDFDDTLYDMLSQMLQHVCEVTPHIMEMMMMLRHWEPSLKRTVDKLSKLTIDSEAQDLCKLFKEDFQIHTLGPEHLVRGFPYDGDVAMLQVDDDISRFSIDDLVSTFEKLSDWDNIPIQEKNEVRANLPPLWTNVAKIKEQLQLFDGCADGPTWFDKMVDVYKGGDVDYMCFRRYDEWPRKMFELSSMVELLDWEILRTKREWERKSELPVFVHPTECVAKQAARLLIRQGFLSEMKMKGHNINGHLMALCEVTNRSGLFHVTRSCIKYAQGSLKTLELEIEALRGLAEQTNNRQLLEEAYIEPENLTLKLENVENPDFIFKTHNIYLLVSRDLKRLTKDGVGAAISQCLDITTNKEKVKPASQSYSDLSSITTVAVTYFDSIWDETDPAERDGLLKTMCDSLNVYLNMNLGDKWKLILDMIICRLDHFRSTPMSEETAVCLLNQIKLVPNLDDFSKDQILSNIDAFPSHLRGELSELQGDSEMMIKLKKCFQLVADVEHLLKDYCRWLGDALRNNDEALWCQTFSNMKEKIFENPYAGADYQVLYRYKKTLYDMEKFDPQSEENKTKLSAIERELRSDRGVLQLPQLCPELFAAPERPSVAVLLGLRRGLTVVKFDKKVTIFPGAVRRPALLTARTHDGGVRRVIVKSGERAAAHAAAVRTLASITSLYPTVNVQTNYTVTALSEDCALIEYLEDRVRLRDLIKSIHPIDDILRNVQRAKNSELILSPQTALNTYNKICSQIPPMILRWAIESTSISVEDFIIRKKNFLESVSIMTIGTFILGVGDRHLENILWSGRGGVCGVDWAALLQYGRAELPPARLSRAVLAAADITALESRLQKLLSILRDNCQLLLPSIRVGFNWLGEEFEEKYSYMESLIRGTALSYHVTQQVIQASDRPYADKYVQLLDEVFADFPRRELYGVAEQVSSILRQSTDPRILSVVRSEWEPWI
ncbi:uncharacterized protein LOC121725568 [Aricia agestis]|uniref:uncharacterized protein LOC121725568 n=1 Tax=Aricia agestis TaxID=91739 RepID=UPI001C204A7D|nr:uncharacterized protein LOC121725568 [Aricia agestis]XP_041968517.1 uncharacterized protein LOC121725568 [Aricia agestis]